MNLTVKITPNDKANPPSKLAEAELRFGDDCGPLSGLKLIGFVVWERRMNKGEYYVTMPARSYSVNGERRSFALLRPITTPFDDTTIKQLVVDAYMEYVERAAADPDVVG